MEQLIMRWRDDGEKAVCPILPKNITVKNWDEIDSPIDKWLDIIQYGLSDKLEDEDFYRNCNFHYENYKPSDCYFFLLNGKEVATITVICDDSTKEGYIHMVAAKPDARGIGIGNLMSFYAVYILKNRSMKTAYLTTDDFRIPAIKTYLKGGFYPDVSTENFKQRWDKILTENFSVSSDVQVESVSEISFGQDGAIKNGLLFRADALGKICVYDLKKYAFVSSFYLEDFNGRKPHSNCVFFGSGYADISDEFPLLYVNVYNAFQSENEKCSGTLLAYRVLRKEGGFVSNLYQIIKIGFTDDLKLWKSLSGSGDMRPYGNFVEDTKSKTLWAFTMRDKEKVTRFFSFAMPDAHGGEVCGENVRKVVLTDKDIVSYFDIDYQNFIQGACFKNGIIYSLEGFGEETSFKNKLKLIDIKERRVVKEYALGKFGLVAEPEMIDFNNEDCYYGDESNKLYKLTFLGE